MAPREGQTLGATASGGLAEEVVRAEGGEVRDKIAGGAGVCFRSHYPLRRAFVGSGTRPQVLEYLEQLKREFGLN